MVEQFAQLRVQDRGVDEVDGTLVGVGYGGIDDVVPYLSFVRVEGGTNVEYACCVDSDAVAVIRVGKVGFGNFNRWVE